MNNRFVNWVMTHKALTASLAVMAVIIGLVGTVLITNKPVSFFGYQLNPLYQYAQIPEPCDPGDPNCLPPPPPPIPSPTVDVPNVLLTIGDSNDSSPNLPADCGIETNGPATVVATSGAADCLKTTINNPKESYTKDFRICLSLDSSAMQCTPWASEGGGNTGQVRSGGSFQYAGVRVENRDLPAGKVIKNVEAGVQVYYQRDDGPCEGTSGMNWAKAITGQNVSSWSYGAQQDDDPGCAQMGLRATMQNTTTTSTINIQGSFPGGTQGTPYTTTLTLSGTPNLPCTWTLVSITPPVAGAAIGASTGIFTATPTISGIFQVAVKVDCQNGQTASNTFPWAVTHTDPPGPQTLAITGTFANGKVNTAYTQAFNITGTYTSPCSWTLVSITPAVSGASIIFTEGGPGTTGTFKATPTVAGTYQVSMKVTCQNNLTATKTLPWVVDSVGTPTSLSITGTFPDSKVNVAYSTDVKTVNAGADNCTLTLVKVTPAVAGATLVKRANVKAETETTATFTATPKTAGNYVVSVSADCPPLVGDGPNRFASKDFTWKVTDDGTPPPPPPVGSASCTDPANLPFLTAIYRYWSPSAGDHLYTTNANEKPSGYRAEGIAGYVYTKQITGTTAVYRSSNSKIGSHYYSTTNDATNYGYKDEGILGYTFASKVESSAPWYRMHKGGTTSDYVHTVSEEERGAIKELGYVDEGIVAYLCGTPQPTELQPIYRMWNGAEKEHFYTTNPAERDTVLSKGFVSEGITGYMYGVRKEGSSPVYRSYHKQEKHHYFSLTESEATKWGYTVEGIVGYIWPTTKTGTVPLYKLFNPQSRDNLYTASTGEVSQAVQAGYEDQGVLGYMFTTAK